MKLDTEKFKIAKQASDLDIEGERLQSELSRLGNVLGELETEGVEGGERERGPEEDATVYVSLLPPNNPPVPFPSPVLYAFIAISFYGWTKLMYTVQPQTQSLPHPRHRRRSRQHHRPIQQSRDPECRKGRRARRHHRSQILAELLHELLLADHVRGHMDNVWKDAWLESLISGLYKSWNGVPGLNMV